MLSNVLEQLVADCATAREFGPGDFLFRQGDRADYVFAVEEGRVRLTRYLSNGKTVCMHVARAGQTFSEAALLSPVYHCNAVADTRSRVRAYSKGRIVEAIGRDPALAVEYIASLAREVQRLRTRLELQNIQSARERILQFLALEAEPGSQQIRVDTSLKDLASDLGLAHETFYRELARLEGDGTITRDERTITLKKTPPV
jgi:CRP/FNR family transcriptional regulator, dissimilatory nitrate respiration regulator